MARKSASAQPPAPPLPEADSSPAPSVDDIATADTAALSAAETPLPESARPDPVSQGPAPQPLAPTAPSRRKGGFLAPFLTGVAAVALGFGGAVYLMPRLPAGWLPVPAASQTDAALAGQAARIDALDKALAALPATPSDAVDGATLDARLSALRDEIAASTAPAAAPDLSVIEGRLSDLDVRLTALEKRPAAGGAVSSTAVEAIDREIAALRAEIAAQAGTGNASAERVAAAAAEAEARIAAATESAENLRAEAEATARRIGARAAVSLIQAALESGMPYDSALAELTAAGVAVPQPLADLHGGGPTLASLRSDFPQAARGALTATTKVADADGFLARVGAFLRSQTGARSVSPKEGDDPDAILSRAEAALATGDLAAALSGVKTLPAEGQAAMAGWIARAETRLAATEALTALAAGLN